MKNCRSECPTNLAVEALGDRCSMLILRHIIFLGQRTYRALLNNSAKASPAISLRIGSTPSARPGC
jgi:DNA-binding HxlR family transcriptional regulator